MHPLNRSETSLFSDRFQLGGPLSISGFRMNGMGPKDGGKLCFIHISFANSHFPSVTLHAQFPFFFTLITADALGGDIYFSAGLSVISDIPKKPDWPVKTHLWVNAGRLDGVDRSEFFFPSLPSQGNSHPFSISPKLIFLLSFLIRAN